MYNIDKDIPVPIPTKQRYPLAAMEVGDSFLVPLDNTDSRIIRNKRTAICSAIHAIGARHKKYVTRKVDEGLRCWRIK